MTKKIYQEPRFCPDCVDEKLARHNGVPDTYKCGSCNDIYTIAVTLSRAQKDIILSSPIYNREAHNGFGKDVWNEDDL